MQERQRQGIVGAYMRRLDENLDQQQLQQLLGEVIHSTRATTAGPGLDYQILAKVIVSRSAL